MKAKALLIAVATAIAGTASANAGGPDLSAYGTPVDPAPHLAKPTGNRWPAHVCAEIQRVEYVAISGPLPLTERGVARGGLLLLEQLHCGIDVSGKMAADRAIVDEEKRRADRDFEDSMIAAQSAASRSREPIIVNVPQAAPEPASAPPATLHCFTTQFGGGISSTNCR